MSYQFSNDVEFKLTKFLQLIGTIKRTILKKVRTETILNIQRTSFTNIFVWIRTLTAHKDEELKRQK